MTHEPINTYRRRIAVAALHRIKRKTGGDLLIVDLLDGNITTIENNRTVYKPVAVAL